MQYPVRHSDTWRCHGCMNVLLISITETYQMIENLDKCQHINKFKKLSSNHIVFVVNPQNSINIQISESNMNRNEKKRSYINQRAS